MNEKIPSLLGGDQWADTAPAPAVPSSAPPSPPFWIDDPQAWDTFYISGYPTPGIADVTAGDRARRIDVKKKPGVDGATVTVLGYDPCTVKLRLKLWTADQWAAWLFLKQKLLVQQQDQQSIDPATGDIVTVASPSSAPVPYDCRHPALASIGVTSLLLSKIMAPKFSGPGGYATIELEWIEFYGQSATQGASSTPTASQAGPSAPDFQALATSYQPFLQPQPTATPSPPSASTATTGP